ncbi:MAG: hypothetical protein ACLQIB_06470 [Isosphaeraceae bacterium]
MTGLAPFTRSARQPSPLLQARIWHLALLVLYVAIAIVDIKDQRRSEPILIEIAAAGFAAYGLLCWLGWYVLRRLVHRLGPLVVVIVYAVTMAALFLAATITYLALEYAYLTGCLDSLMRAIRSRIG